MKYSNKINWAFASAILVSLCWLIGDIFVAGFDPDPGDYPLFSKDYAGQADVVFATLMLEGSTPRLMFGALIGALTGPLLLPATWLVYQFFHRQEKVVCSLDLLDFARRCSAVSFGPCRLFLCRRNL